MLRDELIAAGYKSIKQEPCPKCKQTVELFESDTGKPVRLNLATDEDRPGWLHSLGCGKNPNAEFERDSLPEAPVTAPV